MQASPGTTVSTLGFTYHRDGPGPINVFHTTAPLATVERIYSTMNIASGDFPSALEPFIAKHKKLIMYHGYSDGFITPYRTIQYYVALAALTHGFVPLQENVRLFMLPGMYHCNGGPGPNNFGQRSSQPLIVDSLHDATTALENWVEHAKAPQEFIATKFANDVTSAQGVVRTMPLCSFPAEAKYRGGNVANAANWSCAPHDASLLQVGFDGFEAGLIAPLYDARGR
jgi:hypothetical protein